MLKLLQRLRFWRPRTVCCNICGWEAPQYLDWHGDFGHVYPRAVCGGCEAHPRHRTLHLYLQQKLARTKPLKLLHFAPEPTLQKLFQSYENIHYLSVDLDPGRAMQSEDITRLTFADNEFDIILCVHVLEHIVDDARAMAELFRVLKPGGFAIIDVPIDWKRETTHEDPAITSPEARTKAFWQSDHVRLYGRDFGEKLGRAGFTVLADRFVRSLGRWRIARHGLKKAPLYFCTKPAATAPGK